MKEQSITAGETRIGGTGFTLVEVLAALSIASVLTSLAAPAFSTFVRLMSVSSAASGMVSDLQLARSEAIKRGRRVSLCKSADGQNCASSGGWEQGWIIFEDVNSNGTREGGEQILQRQSPIDAKLRFTGNQSVSRYVSFVPTGSTLLVNGGFQAGTLTVCGYSSQATPARQIVINAAGRARVQKTTLPQCS